MKRKNHAYNLILGCLLLLVIVPAMGAKPKSPLGDLQYEREGGDPDELETFPPSIFPHWVHRIHYRCDACHDSLFEMKLGATPITKDLMKEGKNCGACHNGKLAFDLGLKSCNRCHVAAKK